MKLFKKSNQTTEVSEDLANKTIDPLFTIFEKHLYEAQETQSESEDSQGAFIAGIVKEYLGYLQSRKVIIPHKWNHLIIEELHEQVRQMLVKKMYGCLSIEEFVKNQKNLPALKKQARKKHSKLF